MFSRKSTCFRFEISGFSFLYSYKERYAWWRHEMETFSALLAICAGNSPVHGEFPTQRPVTRSFDVFFDLLSNKRLSKQCRGWWFETQSCPLWRHRNGNRGYHLTLISILNSHWWHRCFKGITTYFVQGNPRSGVGSQKLPWKKHLSGGATQTVNRWGNFRFLVNGVFVIDQTVFYSLR